MQDFSLTESFSDFIICAYDAWLRTMPGCWFACMVICGYYVAERISIIFGQPTPAHICHPWYMLTPFICTALFYLIALLACMVSLTIYTAFLYIIFKLKF